MLECLRVTNEFDPGVVGPLKVLSGVAMVAFENWHSGPNIATDRQGDIFNSPHP